MVRTSVSWYNAYFTIAHAPLLKYLCVRLRAIIEINWTVIEVIELSICYAIRILAQKALSLHMRQVSHALLVFLLSFDFRTGIRLRRNTIIVYRVRAFSIDKQLAKSKRFLVTIQLSIAIEEMGLIDDSGRI